jgi:hypothetical protein
MMRLLLRHGRRFTAAVLPLVGLMVAGGASANWR